MDEFLRELERQAKSGDPEAVSRLHAAYDRIHGEGAYARQQREVQRRAHAEHERRRQQEVVDAVEELINSYASEDMSDEFWRLLNTALEPLFDRGDIYIYHGWAPGSGNQDPDLIVYAANWNPEQMSRLHDLLEQLPDVELDWSDQVTSCHECNRAIQTEPDSYSWTPAYVVGTDFIWCRECAQINAEALFEEYRGDPSRALSPNLEIDPSEHGFINLSEGYQTGFHYGQNDDPTAIAERLQEMGLDNFLFAIQSTGQFDTTWGVWVNGESLTEWLEDAVEETDADVATDQDTAVEYARYLLNNYDEIPEWPENIEEIELE